MTPHAPNTPMTPNNPNTPNTPNNPNTTTTTPSDTPPAPDRPAGFPGIGVAIIIERGQQVLLLRRKHVHGAGSWSTPGGHLEFQETPEECAVREAREETGLEIQNPEFVAITNDIFTAAGKHYISIWMRAATATGTAILGAPYESDAIGWFDWDRLPQPLFLPLQNLLDGRCLPRQARDQLPGS